MATKQSFKCLYSKEYPIHSPLFHHTQIIMTLTNPNYILIIKYHALRAVDKLNLYMQRCFDWSIHLQSGLSDLFRPHILLLCHWLLLLSTVMGIVWLIIRKSFNLSRSYECNKNLIHYHPLRRKRNVVSF